MQELRRQEVACNLCDKSESTKLFTIRSFNVVKCPNCGLVYLNPMPCTEDIVKVYDAREYYCNKGSPADTPLGYPDYLMLKEHHNFVADELLRPLKGINPGKVLDVGCGMGTMLKGPCSATCSGSGLNRLILLSTMYSYLLVTNL